MLGALYELSEGQIEIAKSRAGGSKKTRTLYLFQALRDHALLALLAVTGIRVSELCNIRVGQVDRKKSTRWWIRNMQAKGQNFRDVCINLAGVKVLNEYIYERDRIAPAYNWDSDVLFLNKKGRGVSRTHVNRLLCKLASQYKDIYNEGIHLHPHSFRHTFALETLKRLGQNEMNGDSALPLLAQLMGQQTIAHVKRYTTMSEEMIEEIVG